VTAGSVQEQKKVVGFVGRKKNRQVRPYQTQMEAMLDFEHDVNNVQFAGNVKTRLCGLTGLRKRGVKNAKRVVMFALLPTAKRRKRRKHSERVPPKGKTVATTQGSDSILRVK